MTVEASMQVAQNLSILTRLTQLSLSDNGHLGDLQQLTALRRLRCLKLDNWGQALHGEQHLTNL